MHADTADGRYPLENHELRERFTGIKVIGVTLVQTGGDTPRVTEVVSIFGDAFSIFVGKVIIFGNKGY